MTTKPAELVPIDVTPGVQPSTDATGFSTPHYVFSDKVRSFNGRPQKIGGWYSFTFELSATISGVSRSVYSALISNQIRTMIGTHAKLYGLSGQRLVNITPLLTTTTTIANSLDSDYATLGSNPIATVNGSGVLTITDANYAKYVAGDIITLAGATTTNGILNTLINADHIVRSVGSGSYTIQVGGTASSTGSGGGASVVRKTGLITVNAAAHGLANGDRVKITGAATFAGIADTDINLEFIIRNITNNTFDVFTAGTATSSVTSGGGASTAYQKEIPIGAINETFGQGYGVGLYGAGLYGVSAVSTSGRNYPRIWFFDRFADRIVMTPGNQGSVYIWDGDFSEAPILLANAPTEVNYVFVSDSIVVTFGADNIANRIFASDQGDATEWTSSSENSVFDDQIEGAGRFISHVPVAGQNLIFTEQQTYTFRFIGGTEVWDIELLDGSIGIIAPMARCEVKGVAYWMGLKNFYRWRGANVEIIPANSQDQTTLLNYVFNDMNVSQKSKFFAWYNPRYNEIWFHYASSDSNECDRVARVSLSDNTWWPDTFDRTAAEYPHNLAVNPRLINSNTFYVHEVGTDADGSAMPFSLTTHLRTSGKKAGLISGFVPDSVSVGDITVQLETFQFPQSTVPVYSTSYDIDDTTERCTVQSGGRFWRYTITGEEVGQSFIMGKWQEYVQPSSEV